MDDVEGEVFSTVFFLVSTDAENAEISNFFGTSFYVVVRWDCSSGTRMVC
jgi:hypothetical protein